VLFLAVAGQGVEVEPAGAGQGVELGALAFLDVAAGQGIDGELGVAGIEVPWPASPWWPSDVAIVPLPGVVALSLFLDGEPVEITEGADGSAHLRGVAPVLDGADVDELLLAALPTSRRGTGAR
jgi:hypothetical protein